MWGLDFWCFPWSIAELYGPKYLLGLKFSNKIILVLLLAILPKCSDSMKSESELAPIYTSILLLTLFYIIFLVIKFDTTTKLTKRPNVFRRYRPSQKDSWCKTITWVKHITMVSIPQVYGYNYTLYSIQRKLKSISQLRV